MLTAAARDGTSPLLRPGHTKDARGARGWDRIGMILVQRQLRMCVGCKNHVSRGKFFPIACLFFLVAPEEASQLC